MTNTLKGGWKILNLFAGSEKINKEKSHLNIVERQGQWGGALMPWNDNKTQQEEEDSSSFLTRTQPIKSHGLLIYWYCRSINLIFPSIKILSCCRNQYLRNQAPHSESWRTQVLRFIVLGGPEELTLQALSPEQRGYRVFLYMDKHD